MLGLTRFIPAVSRFAGKAFAPLRGPTTRADALGTILTGLSIAVPAAMQLNSDPVNPSPGEDLAGLGGAAAMGALGAGTGRYLSAPFGSKYSRLFGTAAGGLAGGLVGAQGGRAVYGGLSGLVNDPNKAELDRARQVAGLQNQVRLEALPTELAALQEQARISSDMRARDAYTQALLAAALGRPGVYADPGFSAALAGSGRGVG